MPRKAAIIRFPADDWQALRLYAAAKKIPLSTLLARSLRPLVVRAKAWQQSRR